MQKTNFFRFLLCSLASILMLSSCATSSKRAILSGAEISQERPRKMSVDIKNEKDPWQIWTYRLLLGNQPTKDNGLIQADSLHEKGDLKNALKSYENLFKRKLSPLERASIGVRIASTHLSLQNSKSALSTIGTIYKNTPNGIDDVHPEAALILGYAYAAQGDLDQSLRWFVQFEKLGSVGSQNTSLANQGIRFVLRNASNSSIDNLPTAWSKQPLVSLWLGEERKLRAKGIEPGEAVDVEAGSINAESSLAQQSLVRAKVKIGVILPLSGEHAVLGNSVKEGIELAVSANNPDNLIELVMRDVGSDASIIEENINSLALNEHVHFLIGPLLSSQAAVASTAARLRELPIITFSKSDSFSPGGGVYRLGITSSIQVASLLD
ncbi:MAG: ABC transporter substrate-binding protein, partial [SAR324 cluster bacterium]|nr:ABC transporter substrate-binding protein [SAR324 cluster bacterium]